MCNIFPPCFEGSLLVLSGGGGGGGGEQVEKHPVVSVGDHVSV